MSQAITPFLTDITHFHRDTPDGEYDLTFYPILPGVILALNEIHTTVVPSAPGALFDECFIVNYCLAGRCEFTISEDNYCYIDGGLTSLSAQMVEGRFCYPAGFYRGCELYIFPPLFTVETHAAEQLLELDLTALRSRYLHSMICTTPQELMILWDDLYKAMQTAALGAVRLRTLAVLHWLYTHKTLPQNSSQYLSLIHI